MERILKKVDDRFVWFESPIVVKTHWSAEDFEVVDTSIASTFKNAPHNLSKMKWIDGKFRLQYEATQGKYIVNSEKQIEHKETTLYYNSFVLDVSNNVYVGLVDDYDNEVLLQIN